jgi:hypothetical protein
MNFALPALVVFLVLLPGFLFRSLLRRAERTSLDYSPFGQVVSEAVVWSCLLHGAWLIGSEQILGRELQPAVLLRLLASDPAGQTRAADSVAEHWNWVTAYFSTLLAFSVLAPIVLRWIVTKRRWDRWQHPLSRFVRLRDAPWYYVLTGADFTEENQPDLIAISAVVDVAGEPMLYYGLLDDFFVDQDGVLDRLVMQQVMRRPLKADKSLPPAVPVAELHGSQTLLDRFYPVDGDYFVLRYSEAITLNIEYIKLKSDEGEGSSNQAGLSEPDEANVMPSPSAH